MLSLGALSSDINAFIRTTPLFRTQIRAVRCLPSGPSVVLMCYFDQQLFTCGDWKWGSIRQLCSKACYVGEGCGLKLIWTSQYVHRKCQICCQIEVKRRRISKLKDKIRRWSLEAERWKASIQLARDDIRDLDSQITQREMHQTIRQNCLR